MIRAEHLDSLLYEPVLSGVNILVCSACSALETVIYAKRRVTLYWSCCAKSNIGNLLMNYE